MPDRVQIVAFKNDFQRDGSDRVAELLTAISEGREPPPTEAEWASLRGFWQGKLGRRRRGHHKSMKRHRQGANRGMLRNCMEALKIKLQYDPAEQKVKRTMRANGETYVINRRVAQCMHDQMMKAGRKEVPTVAYLENVLGRPRPRQNPTTESRGIGDGKVRSK